jgi:hypothetical protein
MLMTGEGFLLALASIGLGVAGFSSLILTLRKDPTYKWLPAEIAGFKFMLEHSFGMSLFALIPPLLFYSGRFVEHTIWRIGNGLLAGFLGFLLLNQVIRLLRIMRIKNTPVAPGLLLILYIIPTSALFIVELYKIQDGSIFWYDFGLIFLVIQAAGQFWIFLIGYTRANA